MNFSDFRAEFLEIFKNSEPSEPWINEAVFEETLARVDANLSVDLKALDEQAAMLFEVDGGSTEEIVDLIRCWQVGDAPSLTALCLFAAGHFGLSDDQIKPVLMASILGETPHENAFHNNMHFRKVIVQALRMIVVHNAMADKVLSPEQIADILAAVCVHDLGHDGKGNSKRSDEPYDYCYLERRSFNLAAPYLKAAGLDAVRLAGIKAMLLCTDVGPIGEPESAVCQLRGVYLHHFDNQEKPRGLSDELSALLDNPDLVVMAMILEVADIATSMGLSYEVSVYETALLQEEIMAHSNMPEDAGPSLLSGFLVKVSAGQILLPAVVKLYEDNLVSILERVKEDCAKTGLSYLPPEECVFIAEAAVPRCAAS